MEPGSYDQYLNISLVHRQYEPDTGGVSKALPDHTCDEEDIAKHFPLADPKNTWNKHLWECPSIDQDIEMYGEFNSFSSSYFEIWVEYCNNDTSRVECASREQIEEFLIFKYLVVRMNVQTFEELNMEEHINNSTLEHWLPLHPSTPVRINYKMEYDEIEREDSWI